MPGSGAEQLRLIAAQCKEIGDRGLLNAARAELRAEAAPLIAAMQEQARSRLPRTGGLNEQVAGQKWRVSTRTGARTAGVRIVNSAPDTDQTDSGYVRHPTFGRRSKGAWRVTQTPEAAGWATKTVEDRAPAVAARMAVALDRVVDSIGGVQ